MTAVSVASIANTDNSTRPSTMPLARRRQNPATRTRMRATAADKAGAMGPILLAEISERVAQNREGHQRRRFRAQDARPQPHRLEPDAARKFHFLDGKSTFGTDRDHDLARRLRRQRLSQRRLA